MRPKRDNESMTRRAFIGTMAAGAMVEESTWAWLEIGESSLLAAPLPENVVASAFANRALYLVLANYNNTPAEVANEDAYVRVAETSEPGRKTWKLLGRSLYILRRETLEGR